MGEPKPIVAIVGASSLPGVDRISVADIERAVAAMNAAPVPEDPMVVWFDEAADLEPWQFEALNDTLFGRQPLPAPPPYKQKMPFRAPSVHGERGNRSFAFLHVTKRKSKSQRKARQTMRRNRK